MTKDTKRKKVVDQIAKPQAAGWQALVAGAFLVVITFLAYSPVFRAGFIWDDPDYVLNNRTLRTIDGLREMWLSPTSLPQWYPLVHTTFWIEYRLVGTAPLLYHFDNVLLHVVNALLIWRLLKKLNVPGAFIVGLVFAVHPVMVESVAWVTERKNVLSLWFYLLTMHVYLFRFEPTNREDAKPDWRAYALALVFFLCALFSKTVTASLPATVLLILWWKQSRLRLRDIKPLVPFFVLGIALASVTGHLEQTHVGASGDITVELRLSLVQRCLIAGRAIWFYLGKLLFPYPLTFIYPRWDTIDFPTPAQWALPAFVVLFTIALFMLRNRIGKGVLVAWLIFCGTLFPALGFVNVYPMRYSFVADHFQYHASVAVIALVVALTQRLAPRMRGAIWGMVVVVLGSLTWTQAHIYEDAETLWRDTLVKNPDSWMVNTNLGNALAAQNRYDEAIPYHERALALAPNLHDTRWNYGVALMRQKRVDEAEAEFRKALEITPRFAPAYESLGELYFYHRQDPATATEFYRKSLEIAPTYAKAHYFYALAIEQQANALKDHARETKDPADAQKWLTALNDAIDHYRAAVSNNPDDRDAHYNLATALMQIQQFDEAIWNLRESLRIRPSDAEAWTNLGAAYYQSQKFPDAADAFQQALLINPNLEPAKRGLQAARARG